MKKGKYKIFLWLCKGICIIMCVICLVSIYVCVKAITEVPVFVDLREPVLAIYGGAGMLAAMISFITGKIGWAH